MKCKVCGKNLLINKVECDNQGCKDVWCPDCAEKELEECKVCEGVYCSSHINAHECTPAEEEEEESEEDTEEDIETYYTKSKKFCWFDKSDFNCTENVFERVEQLESQGYVLEPTLSYEDIIVFRKK